MGIIEVGAEPGSQQSVEWLMERVGFCSASRFKDVMATLKNGTPAKARQDYMWELVIERLRGEPVEHYSNIAMDWGNDQEPLSRMAYEAKTGAIVLETGFHRHQDIEWVGCSPDGLIDDDGGFETKSPWNSAVHLQTILTGMPEEHVAQVQGCMWVTGRKWWDFCSYDSRMPEHLQLYVQRIPRDDEYIEALEKNVRSFLAEVDERLAELKKQAEAI